MVRRARIAWALRTVANHSELGRRDIVDRFVLGLPLVLSLDFPHRERILAHRVLLLRLLQLGLMVNIDAPRLDMKKVHVIGLVPIVRVRVLTSLLVAPSLRRDRDDVSRAVPVRVLDAGCTMSVDLDATRLLSFRRWD